MTVGGRFVDAPDRPDDAPDSRIRVKAMIRTLIYSDGPALIREVDELARAAGLWPVAVIAAHPGSGTPDVERHLAELEEATRSGMDLRLASDHASLEPLTRSYAPDLGLSTGFSWRIPAAAIAVPRLGVLNTHPSLLPRHRGPYPIAWTIREGDPRIGVTVHRMDLGFDTGPILAQASAPMPADTSPVRLRQVVVDLWREAFARAIEAVLAGDRGHPQTEELATWAGPFDEAYRWMDPAQPRVALERQVRAWQWVDTRGPLTTIDGSCVVIRRVSFTDPHDSAAHCFLASDGPLWILETAPCPGA